MSLNNYFSQDWIDVIGEEKLSNLLTTISDKLIIERETNIVHPPAGSPLLFRAFRETPYNSLKVCVLGQDVYHDGSYNGLAFGNGQPDEPKPKKISPSLRNILNEVERTEGRRPDPNLYSWAKQGVLLINTAHSVVEGIPESHLDLWIPFTTAIFEALNKKDDLIWMLWGSKAQAYKDLISNTTHSILEAGHPSPLNRSNPFLGCGCFSDCNKLLKLKYNGTPILW